MRDKVLPARTGAGTNAKKFAQRTINAPKMAFYGLLGELFRESTGGGVVLGELFRGSAREVGCWANFFAKALVEGLCWESFVPVDPAEPGGWASFVSLRARCGLHRAFLTHIGAPPIDAAVMRCRYTCARWPCPIGQWESQPGSVGDAFIALRKPPAHASCGGGRQRKHQQAAQAVQTKRHQGRKQCNRRGLTSSRASLGTRSSRAAGSRRAGRGGSRPRARGAR